MIDKHNVDRVYRMVNDAITAVAIAIVHSGPPKEEYLSKGFFYHPMPLEVNDSQMPIVQQEIFGPVLTMQRFDDEA